MNRHYFPRLLKNRWVIALIIFISLMIGLGWWVASINSVATGRIQAGKPGAPRIPEADSQSTQIFRGKYFQFTYPGDYRTANIALTGGRLEAVDLIGINHSAKEITASVIKGSLAEDSGVHLRRLQKDQYIEEPILVGGVHSIAFKSTKNGFEKTAYVTHNDLLASLTLIDPGNKDHDNEFNQIIESFKWQQ